MESPRFPFGNTITPLGLVATIGARFAGEWIAVANWWQNLPWTSVALLLVGMIAGQTWADLSNRNSQLLRWWNYKRRLFELVAVPVDHIQDENERVELWAVIKFTRNIPSSTLVVRVKQKLARLGELPDDCILNLRGRTILRIPLSR